MGPQLSFPQGERTGVKGHRFGGLAVLLQIERLFRESGGLAEVRLGVCGGGDKGEDSENTKHGFLLSGNQVWR